MVFKPNLEMCCFQPARRDSPGCPSAATGGWVGGLGIGITPDPRSLTPGTLTDRMTPAMTGLFDNSWLTTLQPYDMECTWNDHIIPYKTNIL